jgi:pimeloyl-ACP methyl ester carboxylesterase
MNTRHLLACATATTLLLTGCASTTPTPGSKESAPSAVTCPEGPPTGTRCWRGKDSAGAPYLIAMPAQWSGVLVVHAHGGPFLGAPTDARADEDLKRWSITVKQGHAWAGSVFRQGGFAVTAAAQDTERVRQLFREHIATPRRTLLHGQSWGGMVAARAGEMFPQSWDGILLTSGVLAGPSTYDFRLDLRALYSYYCNNHPLDFSQTSPPQITSAQLAERANTCLGVRTAAAQRTPEQQGKLTTLSRLLRIPESSILGHLNWATFSMADIVYKRTGGATPFGNDTVRYQGSADDTTLNAKVQRIKADPVAKAKFAADSDHAGNFRVPVITAHGIDDATVFVEGNETFRQKMQAAGTSRHLVQTFVRSSEHSYWGDAQYPPLFEALLQWVDRGEKPSAHSISARCAVLNGSACSFDPTYRVQPLSSRIYPR